MPETTTIAILVEDGRIAFGDASIAWRTDDITKGGAVNVVVPVGLDGKVLGHAHFGAFLHTSVDTMPPGAHVEENGFWVDHYEDAGRRWEYYAATSPELTHLAPADKNPSHELIEAAIVAAGVDYRMVLHGELVAFITAFIEDIDISIKDLARIVQLMERAP